MIRAVRGIKLNVFTSLPKVARKLNLCKFLFHVCLLCLGCLAGFSGEGGPEASSVY